MTPELHWENAAGCGRGRGWRRYLLAGNCRVPIASMEKRAVQWSGHVELPGITLRKAYAPMAEMESDIETKILAWFAEVLS